MKETVCTIFGVIGSCIAGALGGWTSALNTLLIFMIIDYVTGLLVAFVFTKSPKTKNGGASSKVGFIGIIKKIMLLVLILVGHQIDIVLGVEYVRNGIIIAFIVNELISITENTGLMGVPLPKILVKAIDLLNDKKEGFGNE